MTAFKDAFDVFAKTIAEDQGLYYAYQSNIAMCVEDVFVGAGYRFPVMHEMINKGARDFLDLLISKSFEQEGAKGEK